MPIFDGRNTASFASAVCVGASIPRMHRAKDVSNACTHEPTFHPLNSPKSRKSFGNTWRPWTAMACYAPRPISVTTVIVLRSGQISFPTSSRRGTIAGMAALKSIAVRFVKVCVYVIALLAYMKLGGDMLWIVWAGIAYGWFYILRQA